MKAAYLVCLIYSFVLLVPVHVRAATAAALEQEVESSGDTGTDSAESTTETRESAESYRGGAAAAQANATPKSGASRVTEPSADSIVPDNDSSNTSADPSPQAKTDSDRMRNHLGGSPGDPTTPADAPAMCKMDSMMPGFSLPNLNRVAEEANLINPELNSTLEGRLEDQAVINGLNAFNAADPYDNLTNEQKLVNYTTSYYNSIFDGYRNVGKVPQDKLFDQALTSSLPMHVYGRMMRSADPEQMNYATLKRVGMEKEAELLRQGKVTFISQDFFDIGTATTRFSITRYGMNGSYVIAGSRDYVNEILDAFGVPRVPFNINWRGVTPNGFTHAAYINTSLNRTYEGYVRTLKHESLHLGVNKIVGEISAMPPEDRESVHNEALEAATIMQTRLAVPDVTANTTLGKRNSVFTVEHVLANREAGMQTLIKAFQSELGDPSMERAGRLANDAMNSPVVKGINDSLDNYIKTKMP